jgi:hypothetical protein
MAWRLVSVALLCALFILASWGIRLALWHANADFAGPVCTMFVVFLSTIVLGGFFEVEGLYKRHLMERVGRLRQGRGGVLGGPWQLTSGRGRSTSSTGTSA